MRLTNLCSSRLRFVTTLGIALLVLVSLFGWATPSWAQNKSQAQGATPFLTLPFAPHEGMNILSGWYYSSSGGLHNGIDYINGNVNSPKTWNTFPVLASADGVACGNCSGRQGNAVWIKHNVNGVTYYSYYGHLASISPDIPVGSQSRTLAVKRGQFLGMAGDTGAGSGIVHLHFALYTASSTPIDPYGIGKLREAYPVPHAEQPGIGWFLASSTESGGEPNPNTESQPNSPNPPDSGTPSNPDTPPADVPKSDEEPDESQGEAGGGEGEVENRPGYRSTGFSHLAQ